MKERTDMIGKKFWRLTVLRRDESKKRRSYVCQCDCGNIKSVRSDHLTGGGRTRSCGCWQREFKKINLKNDKFGRLLVMEEAPKRRGRTMWLCRCDCGNEKVIGARHLVIDGGTKSCGCLSKDHNKKHKLSYGESSFNRLLSTYKKGAKTRNFEFDLNNDQFKRITQQNCHYCGDEPFKVFTGKTYYGEYVYNGVDRVDNKIGYVVSNCVPCCCICNKMKMILSVEEFLNQINKIYSNHSSAINSI